MLEFIITNNASPKYVECISRRMYLSETSALQVPPYITDAIYNEQHIFFNCLWDKPLVQHIIFLIIFLPGSSF